VQIFTCGTGDSGCQLVAWLVARRRQHAPGDCQLLAFKFLEALDEQQACTDRASILADVFPEGDLESLLAWQRIRMESQQVGVLSLTWMT
jgi:hypothetical protein